MKNWWPLRGDEGGVEARISAEEILGHALTPISVCTVILLGVWLSLRARLARWPPLWQPSTW